MNQLFFYGILFAVGGYLIGSLNPAYFIARLRGFDIRTRGSENAGGSNALITMGKAVGIFCIVFDFLKGYFCFKMALFFFPKAVTTAAIAGFGCVAGHIFPFYMRFRGGKGFASFGGVVLAYSAKVFLILILCEIIVLVLTKYLCLVSISSSLAFPFIFGIVQKDFIGAVFLFGIGLMITGKHLVNLMRIKNGTEMRITALFGMDREIERITAEK